MLSLLVDKSDPRINKAWKLVLILLHLHEDKYENVKFKTSVASTHFLRVKRNTHQDMIGITGKVVSLPGDASLSYIIKYDIIIIIIYILCRSGGRIKSLTRGRSMKSVFYCVS